MAAIREPIYSDLSLNLTAHPVTGNISIVSNADAVKNSVKYIVLTNFFERPYSPDLAGNVLAMQFENGDPFTEFEISKNIRNALNNYEPRAIVDDVIVQFLSDQTALRVTIIFRIRNQKEPISVDVLLEKVR